MRHIFRNSGAHKKQRLSPSQQCNSTHAPCKLLASCADATSWICGVNSTHAGPCREELAGLYTKFAQKYPIVFFEDPYEEESFSEFTKFTASVDCQVSPTSSC